MRKARREPVKPDRQPVLTGNDTPVPAVPAASVVVLRDTPNGVETLLLERPKTATFAPGALVFPGGKVNPDDSDIAAVATRETTRVAWQHRLHLDTPDAAGAFLAAAVRETYEETGVLLACDKNGRPLAQQRTREDQFAQLRHLSDRDAAHAWVDVFAHEQLLFDVDRLTFLSWWITPHGYPRRFDTRFFALRIPDDATVTPAPGEIVSASWLRPADALTGAQNGQHHIIYPTRKNLADLAVHTTTTALLSVLQQRSDTLRPVCPTLVEVNGRLMVVHPDGGEPEDE